MAKGGVEFKKERTIVQSDVLMIGKEKKGLETQAHAQEKDEMWEIGNRR